MVTQRNRGLRSVVYTLVLLIAMSIVFAYILNDQITYLDANHKDYAVTHNYPDDDYEALLTIYQEYVSTYGYANIDYDALNATYQEYVLAHNYTGTVYESLAAAYQDYILTHSYANTEYNALNVTYQDYISTHNYTNIDYEALLTIYQEYVLTHNYTDAEYESLAAAFQDYVSTHDYSNLEYEELENERDLLRSIVELAESIVWVDNLEVSQSPGSYTMLTFSTPFAGYVSVNVTTSTTDKTYVRVLYSANGVNYDETISVGESGTAVFPVLPTDDVQVRIGNTDKGRDTETVTVTYHY